MATVTKAAFLTLRLTHDLLNWYAREAHAKGIRRSHLIRQVLEQHRDAAR